MFIRKYEAADCKEIADLFYHTVHTVNAKDYSKEQLDVWATGKVNYEEWNQSFLSHFSVVAIEDERIVGFGDMDDSGYLDRLYVHKDYQKQGIADSVCDELERAFPVKDIVTHASITAKPFFEKRGYQMIKKQEVERGGILLTNYVMKKEIKMNELLKNLDKLHTTEMGVDRIKRNLSLDVENVVEWCKIKLKKTEAVIERKGKNWYVMIDNFIITVNAYSYTIITAHPIA